MIKSNRFTATTLAEFRQYQRLSFDILESAAAELRAGQTEQEVARALVRRYRQAGDRVILDAAPHVRQWGAIGNGSSYAPRPPAEQKIRSDAA